MSILSVLAWPYTRCHDQAEQESKAAQEASLRAGTAGRPHGLGPTHAMRRLSERSVSAQALGAAAQRASGDLCWRSPIGSIMLTSLPQASPPRRRACRAQRSCPGRCSVGVTGLRWVLSVHRAETCQGACGLSPPVAAWQSLPARGPPGAQTQAVEHLIAWAVAASGRDD